jgi:outer membrane protein assembly factor BamB
LYIWYVNATDGVHWTNETFDFTTCKNIEPFISDVYPNNQNAPYNPRLTVTVYDPYNDPLTVIFKTNASGTWKTLKTYYGTNKVYTQDPTGMDIKNERYYWSANISDGTFWVNNTYFFTAQAFILKWSYNTNSQITKPPLASDVDRDGIYEVFTIGNDNIFCFNGSTGQVKWNYIYGGFGYDSQMEIGDLNNDGIEELIASAYSRTIALHANNGTVYWMVQAESSTKNIVIADIDGNGYPYVYIAADGLAGGDNGSGRIRKLRGTDGAILAEHFIYRPCYGSLSFADSDNDGKFEIYSGDRSYDYSTTGAGRGVQCFDADTLELLWYHDKVVCSSHCPVLVDVNKDGILDTVVMQQHYDPAGIYVIDGKTWDKMPGKWADSLSGSGLTGHSQPSIYDIDNDGNLCVQVLLQRSGIWGAGP